LPHSSSSSRFTAGASAFFILSQSGERPERYGEPFRFDTMDAFQPELACVPKHGLAVAFDMLVKLDARAGLGHELADLKWIMPQIVAVEFDQIEGIKDALSSWRR
jgi:hypothetical protein